MADLNFGKNLFPRDESFIATFDSKEIADGTGVIVFDGFSDVEETTTSYNLSNNQPQSNSVLTKSATIDVTTFTKVLDLDFDLTTFNLPKTIEGTAIINATGEISAQNGTRELYFIAKIRKWDGSSETEVASVQSQTMTKTTNATVSKTFCMRVAIPRTPYNKGETLRVTMEVWTKNSQNSNYNVFIWHDPSDDSTPSTGISSEADSFTPGRTSRLTFLIPFDLNNI